MLKRTKTYDWTLTHDFDTKMLDFNQAKMYDVRVGSIKFRKSFRKKIVSKNENRFGKHFALRKIVFHFEQMKSIRKLKI